MHHDGIEHGGHAGSGLGLCNSVLCTVSCQKYSDESSKSPLRLILASAPAQYTKLRTVVHAAREVPTAAKAVSQAIVG